MTNSRKHFSLEEWADFGRERASEEARAEMEQHLVQGCARCAQVLELWKTVQDMARREQTFEPPANAVRCAKAMFSAMPLARAANLTLRIARLAGFRQPVLEGVRGAAPAASHFLFQEGAMLLDLYLQPQAGSDVVSVVGQLLDSARPERRFENQPVAVIHDQRALARTTTNEFGEFRLEFEQDENLLLAIELEDEWYLVSPLPSTAEG
jgi:hypothetical protein